MPRQHFLPQFYLRGFTDPDAPADQDPYVWVYRFADATWKRRAPHNIAAESGLYDVTDREGRVSHYPDEFLQRVESIAAPIVQRKILKSRLLRREQRADFAFYVALMHRRVPAQYENLREPVSVVIKRTMDEIYRRDVLDPERFEALKDLYRRERGEELPDIPPEALDPSRYKITATKAAVLHAAFAMAQVEAADIYRMAWAIWQSQAPHYFITSDHPFSVIDRTQPDPLQIPGLRSMTAQMTLPISRTSALMATWGRAQQLYGSAPQEFVESINMRTALYASEFLIAPKPFTVWQEIRDVKGAPPTKPAA